MPIQVGTINAPLNGVIKVVDGNGNVYYQIGGSYYELIEDITISTATTSVTFDNFTATKEDSLVLVADINNTSGSNASYSLYVNNDTTAINYYEQAMFSTGSVTPSGAIVNNAVVSNIDASDKGLCIVDIKLTNDGYFTSKSGNNKNYGTTDVQLNDYVKTKIGTITSITQVDYVASVSNAIGIGSRLRLYRRLS